MTDKAELVILTVLLITKAKQSMITKSANLF